MTSLSENDVKTRHNDNDKTNAASFVNETETPKEFDSPIGPIAVSSLNSSPPNTISSLIDSQVTTTPTEAGLVHSQIEDSVAFREPRLEPQLAPKSNVIFIFSAKNRSQNRD
jgi:hypothetical protein